MKETAEEYISRVTKSAKEYYKKPEVMIDEQIQLLTNIKTNIKDKEKLWDIAVAVSEAYHVVLWVNENEKATRLVNTIFSWVSKNTTGI